MYAQAYVNVSPPSKAEKTTAFRFKVGINGEDYYVYEVDNMFFVAHLDQGSGELHPLNDDDNDHNHAIQVVQAYLRSLQ